MTRGKIRAIAVLSLLLAMADTWAGSEEASERNNLGVQLLRQGRAEEAIVEFHKAVALDPGFAAARLNLAYVYDGKGQIEEAIAEYLKAVEIEPQNLFAYNNLGVLYSKKGLYDDAFRVFEKVLQIDPANANALKNLQTAKRNKTILQEREEQIARARQEVEANPNSPAALYRLARLYAFHGKKDEAIEWLTKTLKLGYNDFDYLKADPALKELRDDPRFTSLLKAR